MDRDEFDRLRDELKTKVESVAGAGAFPLNAAVEVIVAQHERRLAATLARAEVQERDLRLLEFFDITSVGAALAIRGLSKKTDDSSGVSTTLVDVWTQSEAARCLWFDRFASRGESEVGDNTQALGETAKLLASEAIGAAIRMREPVTQYVEFVEKVVSSREWRSKLNS